jgi:hypothetical protein
MAVVASIERVCERVQLVQGKGDRRKGRLCIMSFVALLAGERHTDAPVTASPFIRHYAIALNDGMPEAERQRLKLFAPRIVGTNDGLDAGRLHVLRSAFSEEIVPRLRANMAADWRPIPLTGELTRDDPIGVKSLQDFTLAFAANTGKHAARREINQLAIIGAKLLISCANSAPHMADRGWYWSKAIDLLDRLCDVGPPVPHSSVCPEHLARADIMLRRTGGPGVTALTVSEMLRRAWRRLGKGLTACGASGPSPKKKPASSSEITPAVMGESENAVQASPQTPVAI